LHRRACLVSRGIRKPVTSHASAPAFFTVYRYGGSVTRYLSCLAVAVVLTGCATYAPSIPENYRGPRALLEDSATTHSGSKADFFVVEEIDGAKVDNSLNATLRANQGRGMSMTPTFINRALVADKPIKVGIKGRTHFAAPILALTGTVYQVKGAVEFTPRANGKYIVRGEFGEKYSTIWVEDAATSQPVGNRIEVAGSAKLGLLEK
jgi:hypothetical protein